jgi:tetratricopeptide (TPR) repeat protein
MNERALALFHGGKYREALAALNQRDSVAPADHGMGLIRGWSLYHLNRYDEALALFLELDRRESTNDTQYGVYYSRRKLDPAHIGD